MLKNKLIIAAAGSGKTTFLIDEASRQKGRILILTYTLANEASIRKKFVEMYGYIPSNVTISPWFKFLLSHGVKPYQSVMHSILEKKEVKGLLLVNTLSGIKYTNKQGFPVPFSEEEFERHYFTSTMKIYSDKLSKFVEKVNKKSQHAVINRLSKIFTHIFIDEVQDLAGYDLELIKLFCKSPIKVLLVGDPRQVTYLTHHPKKNREYVDGKIKDFVEKNFKNIPHEIDEITLSTSHRSNQEICNFATQLYPELSATISCDCCGDSSVEHQGVFLVKESQLAAYMQKYSCVQLRWDKRINVLTGFAACNMGESKGLTFDRVLVYPTVDMKKWIKSPSEKLEPATRAKLYVAITRAKYSAAIVIKDNEKFDSPHCLMYGN